MESVVKDNSHLPDLQVEDTGISSGNILTFEALSTIDETHQKIINIIYQQINISRGREDNDFTLSKAQSLISPETTAGLRDVFMDDHLLVSQRSQFLNQNLHDLKNLDKDTIFQILSLFSVYIPNSKGGID